MWAWVKRGACLGCVVVPVVLVVLLVVLVAPLGSRGAVRGQGGGSVVVPSCVPLGVVPGTTGASRRVVGPGC
jgi:hypothetical protein